MSIFDEIYNKNIWGFGSGHGSLPSVTKGYRKFLENFIKDNNIKSVVDYGCGDDAKPVFTFTGPKSFLFKERKWFPAWKKMVLLYRNPFSKIS